MFSILNSAFCRKYIIPGAVLQSVMVGGGYGTGREIVEYFSSYGSVGGLLGLIVAFASLSSVFALTFEFARRFSAFDYRSFFRCLLGRGWLAFEVLMIFLFLLILAVLASAAGNILRDELGIPYWVGLVVMLFAVGLLTFFGRNVIEKALVYWSVFLYAIFIAFFASVISSDGAAIAAEFSNAVIVPGWWKSGLQYALYNVAVAPLLLYVARNFEIRREAVGSGVMAGGIVMMPALIFQVAFSARYPEIVSQAVPVYWMMASANMSSLLMVAYTAMLFGTFIETGAGMLQGINERIDAFYIEKRHFGLSRSAHATIAVSAIGISAAFSLWGITNLIAEGYGTMAWGFLVVYVIPLLTLGLFKVLKSRAHDIEPVYQDA